MCTKTSIWSECSERNLPPSLSFLLDFATLAKYVLHPTLHPWLVDFFFLFLHLSELVHGVESLILRGSVVWVAKHSNGEGLVDGRAVGEEGP